MDKKKIEMLVIGIGLMALVLLLLNNVKESAQTKASPILSGQGAGYPALPNVSSISKASGKNKESDNLKWGRDPFALTQDVEDNTQPLKLMGITMSDKPMAVIDDEIVSVGKKIGDYKVIRIAKYQVVLNDGKKDVILKLEQ
jgi:hypothetical protein